jgi:hypothetical protein
MEEAKKLGETIVSIRNDRFNLEAQVKLLKELVLDLAQNK